MVTNVRSRRREDLRLVEFVEPVRSRVPKAAVCLPVTGIFVNAKYYLFSKNDREGCATMVVKDVFAWLHARSALVF